MGQAYLLPQKWKEDEPSSFAPNKYDPHFGFKEDRKVRDIPFTEEEMNSCNIEPKERGFCVRELATWRGCNQDHYPLGQFYCRGYLSELQNCHMDERLFEMKEFEREKRLNARERRLREKAQE